MQQPSLEPERTAGPPPPPPPSPPFTVTVHSQQPEPWALDHHLHHLVQTQSRPGQPETDGTRWAERRRTGKAMILCQCGWTTGMVDVAELPDVESLKAEHPDAWALASPTPNAQVTEST